MNIETLTEEKLTISKVDPRLLYGFNDANLKKVESAFPQTTIVGRGNQLILRGRAEDVQKIKQIITELIQVLRRQGQLTANDVDTVLDLYAGITAGHRPEVTEEGEVILFSPKGKVIQAKTPGQKRLVEAARTHDIVFAIGPAGTGKTYTAVALAVAALNAQQVRRIVLSRPAVEAGERLGFLPGDFREKIDPYLRPLYDALEDMLPREKLRSYLDQNIIEIVPLAYMRGRTLSSAYVILDEAQNATTTQMKMFLTRLGANSRAIVTGDITQTDLPRSQESGLMQVQKILERVEGIKFEYFSREDVVRHRLVKDIIDAYERYHSEERGASAEKPDRS